MGLVASFNPYICRLDISCVCLLNRITSCAAMNWKDWKLMDIISTLFLLLCEQDWWDDKLPESGIMSCLSVIPKVLLAGAITLMDEAYYKLAVWLNDRGTGTLYIYSVFVWLTSSSSSSLSHRRELSAAVKVREPSDSESGALPIRQLLPVPVLHRLLFARPGEAERGIIPQTRIINLFINPPSLTKWPFHTTLAPRVRFVVQHPPYMPFHCHDFFVFSNWPVCWYPDK